MSTCGEQSATDAQIVSALDEIDVVVHELHKVGRSLQVLASVGRQDLEALEALLDSLVASHAKNTLMLEKLVFGVRLASSPKNRRALDARNRH